MHRKSSNRCESLKGSNSSKIIECPVFTPKYLINKFKLLNINNKTKRKISF